MGLSENDAIQLTAGWREQFNHPRLSDDSFLLRLFESGNIQASDELSAATLNLRYHTLVKDLLGIKPHHAIHSRRMGHLIGRLLVSDFAQGQQEYLAGFVQPADADAGEPINESSYRAVNDRLLARQQHSGWLLERVTVTLASSAASQAHDLDNSELDPVMSIRVSGQQVEWFPAVVDRRIADWRPRLFCPLTCTAEVEVCDQDLLARETLGTLRLPIDSQPLTTFSADVKRNVHWSAELAWSRAHE